MSKVENYMDSKEGESQSSEQLGQQTTEFKTYVKKTGFLGLFSSFFPVKPKL